ncbi:MAG: hypothetical protein MI810_15940, partial [Flavobacteriales bacterium]|nr:hypothetical protein [Flavobacteriales bacterium]
MRKTFCFLNILFLLGIGQFAFASDDNLINGLKGTEISASGAQLYVTDMWYDQYLAGTEDNYFSVLNTQVKVKLWYDDALKNFYDNWDLDIEYDLVLTREDGTEDIYNDQNISIDYDNDGSYRDFNLKLYDSQIYVKAYLTNISVTTTLGSLPDDIHLDLELNTERYYNLDSDELCVLTHNTDNLSTTNEVELVWSYIEGAESYDVEWLFIDIPGTESLSTYSEDASFKNATRVNVLSNHYKISMAYPRGLFLFRVRPVGKTVIGGQVKRIEGSWSLNSEIGDPSTVSADERFEWSGLLSTHNWQYQVSFAEEGKKGEALGIYDGGLKPRQNVVINNSENTAVISQAVYDYLGRPAITLLPTPVENEGLGFYPDRLLSGADYSDPANYYDYNDFDLNSNIESPTSMVGLEANDYYNGDGSAIGFHSEFIADAEDYPFARTLYTNDGTNRVRKQSAFGGQEIGPSSMGSSSKISRYIYGTPVQEELYRLYGNEVGNASHYKKNVVIDQNGQAHIQYLDMSGRVIGTALGGDAPDNLMEIDSYPDSFDEITADLTINNSINTTGELIVNKTITVPYPTTYEFYYDLDPTSITNVCLPSSTINIKYDLTIYIQDEKGNYLDIDYDGDLATEPAISYTNITSLNTPLAPLDFSYTFIEPGAYTIVKVLKIHENDLEISSDLYTTFFTDQECHSWTDVVSTPCTPTCEELCFLGHGFYAPNGDKVYLDEDGEPIGYQVEGSETIALYPDKTSEELSVITTAISECESSCSDGPDTKDEECDIKYANMVADMSPGGQYYDNIPFGESYDPVTANDWLTTEHSSMYSSVDAAATGWDWIKSNWTKDYIEDMLKLHPEYCIYAVTCGVGENDLLKGTYNGATISVPDCSGFSGLMDDWDYDMLMFTSDEDIWDGHAKDYLFNPLETTQNTTSGVGNEENYQLFDNDLTDGQVDPYIACRPHIKSEIETMLKQFLYDGTNYHSIWYVLDDPDDIHLTPAYTPTEVYDYYVQLHGDGTDPGLLGTGSDQITRYEYFRSVYTFIRDYVEYNSLYDFSPIITPSVCDSISRLETPDNNGLSAEGFIVHFPQNPLFEEYDPSNLSIFDDFIDTEITDACTYQCEGQASAWLEELDGCASSANLAIIEDYFIDICKKGCDSDNPIGTDDISPTVSANFGWGTFSSFEAVIDYYNTNFDPDCGYVTHPPASAEELTNDCSCNVITTYLTNFYENNSVSLPASFNDIAGDLNTTQEDDLISAVEELLSEDEESTITVTIALIQGWANNCINGTPFTDLIAAFDCATPDFDNNFDEFDAACGDALDDLTNYYGNLITADQVLEAWIELKKSYREAAFNGIKERETFSMTYDIHEYHYTLFYYDQAGNLVKTVPPAGVYRKANGVEPAHSSTLIAAEIQDCKDHVLDPVSNPYVHPGSLGLSGASEPHQMVTNYKYNSLQQLVEQTTPDGGTTKFWYDELGRLIVSQNARQAGETENVYSYTIYDVLGRIKEVGEIWDTDPMTEAIATNSSDYYDWLTTNASSGTPDRKEVVRTHYNEYAQDETVQEITNEMENASLIEPYNLRGRIASVTYIDQLDPSDTDDDFDNAVHYNYDYAGNVKTHLAEYADIAVDFASGPMTEMHLVRTDYTYDLVSGNVIQVDYQNNKADQFHYKYEYDANNRLTNSYSSTNGEIWDKDCKSFYYAHGSMAREEVGQQVVQAKDYVYTLNGWLKTVNSSVNNHLWDAGRDGKDATLDEFGGRDAFGFSLHYFEGDYLATDNTYASNLLVDYSGHSIFSNTSTYDLYNGNIGRMITSVNNYADESGENILANLYRYDQLQRIKKSNVYEATTAGLIRNNNEITNANAADAANYTTAYTFDGNGNLLTLDRNGGSGTAMDDLAYHYDYNSTISGQTVNRLLYVDDAVSAGSSSVDVDDQSAANYSYNEIGQLVGD